jgi:hypothetical protein
VTGFVPGTQTAVNTLGLLSFSSVSIRGGDVYRVRPEEGAEFLRHRAGDAKPVRLGGFPSIASPVLTKDHAIYAGWTAALYVVPLDGGPLFSFATPFGAAITAPAAVCDGRVIFGCEDGYLYVLGPTARRRSVQGPRALENPEPADRPLRRREVRLVHELRRRRLHELETTRASRCRSGSVGPGGWRGR